MVEALKAKGASPAKFPAYYFREPPKGECNDWLIQAYFWTCSERKFERGPIPWSARMLYCDTYGLSLDVATMVSIVIGKLDDRYWKHVEEMQERQKKQHGREISKSKKAV